MDNSHLSDIKMAFEKFSSRRVSQVVFIHDYFQIIMQENYLTFLSETFIKTDEGEYQIPSKDGNWNLYNLIDKDVTDIEEKEGNVVVTFNNGWKITVDTFLEPSGDNFNMGGAGLIPIHI